MSNIFSNKTTKAKHLRCLAFTNFTLETYAPTAKVIFTFTLNAVILPLVTTQL